MGSASLSAKEAEFVSVDAGNMQKNVFQRWSCGLSPLKRGTPAQNAIYSKTMASVAGRTLTNSLIAGRLATTIAQRSSFLVAVRGGLIGNTLLIGGMTERCIYTSEKLQKSNPEVYNTLRVRNYDLLYFLPEPALNPFLEALNVKRTQGQSAFERIIEMVEKEVNANAR